MFGEIGLAELLVIGFVVIVITKPQDLPVLMRRIGILTAHIQSFIYGVWGGWQEKLGLISTQDSSVKNRNEDEAR
ncbi:MAG: hypothetical protein DI585_05370 [Pseudomonas fluorescens]|nr:MAG: hypothetical protein DI585_05370 [Pseudomonas fluorescens]